MQTRNALLRNGPYHLNDNSLRETLENNMDQGLERRVRSSKEEVSLRKWIEAVKTEDEFLKGERELLLREMYRKEQRNMKSANNGRTMGTRIENTAPSM
jgi:hypothetical protein